MSFEYFRTGQVRLHPDSNPHSDHGDTGLLVGNRTQEIGAWEIESFRDGIGVLPLRLGEDEHFFVSRKTAGPKDEKHQNEHNERVYDVEHILGGITVYHGMVLETGEKKIVKVRRPSVLKNLGAYFRGRAADYTVTDSGILDLTPQSATEDF